MPDRPLLCPIDCDEGIVGQPDEYGPLLSFRFDRAQYETVLGSLLSEYESSAARGGAQAPAESSRRRWFWRGRGN